MEHLPVRSLSFTIIHIFFSKSHSKPVFFIIPKGFLKKIFFCPKQNHRSIANIMNHNSLFIAHKDYKLKHPVYLLIILFHSFWNDVKLIFSFSNKQGFCGMAFVVISSGCLMAQETSTLEQTMEFPSRESALSPILDVLEYYTQKPLSLHRVQVRELSQLPGFSFRLCILLVKFVAEYPHCTYQQISDSLHLSIEQRFILERCTTLNRSFFDTFRGKIFYRIRCGYEVPEDERLNSGTYTGSPANVYQQLSYLSEHIECTITTEKDAGEANVVDFISFSSRIRLGTFTIIAGDYTVESASGLMVWRSYGAKKGSEVLSAPDHHNFAVFPYRSAIESQFFRGLALSGSIPMNDSSVFRFMLWGSAKPSSGTLDSTGTVVTAFDRDGLFRSADEIAGKHSFTERAVGSGIEWSSSLKPRHSSASVGVSFLYLQYSKVLVTRSRSVISGSEGFFTSIFGFLGSEHWSFRAEVLLDYQRNIGLRMNIGTNGKRHKTSVLFRWLAPELRSPFGYCFGENSRPGNEIGLYSGFEWDLTPEKKFSVFFDYFFQPAPGYAVSAPVRGYTLFFELKTPLFFEGRYAGRLILDNKTDQQLFSNHQGIEQRAIVQFSRVSFRNDVWWKISQKGQMRFRIEAILATFEGLGRYEPGLLSFLELEQQFGDQYSLVSRIIGYSSKSYASALWMFEPSVPGILMNRALFGNGVRLSTLFRCNVLQWCRFYTSVTMAYNFQPATGINLQMTSQLELRF